MNEPASVEVRASAIEGSGLFALRRFASGERIVPYTGERISKAESLRRCELGNPYIFSIDTESDLDGKSESNLARFANHSCLPNSEAVLEEGEIWLLCLRGIGIGEEITFDYGYDLEDFRDHPCLCGAPGCRGFIVAEELRD